MTARSVLWPLPKIGSKRRLELDASFCHFFSISLPKFTIYGISRDVPVLSAGPDVNH
jgi:hypothetical protein